MTSSLSLCTEPTCANPTEADDALCGLCLGRLMARLREVPEVMGELLITTTRQDVSPPQPGRSGSTEPPLVYRPDPAEAGRDLNAVLVSAVSQVLVSLGLTWSDIDPRVDGRRDIRAHRDPLIGPPRPPVYGQYTYGSRDIVDTRAARFPDDDTLELALWLARHPSAIREHPEAGAMVDEIEDAIARCCYAVDRPDATRRYLGRCDTCTPATVAASGLGEWATELWAHEDATWVTCRICATSYDIAERRDAMIKRAEGLLVTAEAASRALPLMVAGTIELSPDVIRGWWRRHGLARHPPHKDDPHQRVRYRLGDLIDQIAAARARAAARTAPPVELLTQLDPAVAALFEQVRRAAGAQPSET